MQTPCYETGVFSIILHGFLRIIYTLLYILRNVIQPNKSTI